MNAMLNCLQKDIGGLMWAGGETVPTALQEMLITIQTSGKTKRIIMVTYYHKIFQANGWLSGHTLTQFHYLRLLQMQKCSRNQTADRIPVIKLYYENKKNIYEK